MQVNSSGSVATYAAASVSGATDPFALVGPSGPAQAWYCGIVVGSIPASSSIALTLQALVNGTWTNVVSLATQTATGGVGALVRASDLPGITVGSMFRFAWTVTGGPITFCAAALAL